MKKEQSVNKDLFERVTNLVNEVESTHRYSMSKIYGLFNEVYGTSEVPQSCASCLIRKVKDLKSWLEDNKYKPKYIELGDKL